jgi:transcription initiation factor TFIID subunit TAF12
MSMTFPGPVPHVNPADSQQKNELTIRTLSVPRTVLRKRITLSSKGVEGPNTFAMVRGLRPPMVAFSDMASR